MAAWVAARRSSANSRIASATSTSIARSSSGAARASLLLRYATTLNAPRRNRTGAVPNPIYVSTKTLENMKAVLFAVLLTFTAATARAQDSIPFVEHTALGGKVALMAPATFGQMTAEAIRVKYPRERPPTEVLSNDRGSVTIALGHTQTALAPADVSQAHAAMERQIKATFPTSRWNRSEVVQRGNRNVGVLDFWSPTPDTEVRNIMVVTSVQGRAMIVSFNVTRELEREWGAIGERIMNSIRVIE